ncbi:Protein CBR-SRV-7 [Caenorhabditis briggsae]|uniref:Protein CBR-SRV-7 n=1 Tax=Caenorhabditis briggsae TaxID=6238 RepID=A8XKI6_CAEBR|nr:Protein CBR-SRV-7 [Caenorhabditis briggsae]CAP33160.2 Protein CBR-SRV-7 [Caenorhabditis briggsae]
MASNATLPEWFDPLESIVSTVFMMGSFVTIILYIMEVLILVTLRNTVYKGMFYQIFTVGIIVDVFSLVNNYFGCVFPAKGYFQDFYLSMGTFVGQMYLMIAWTARGIQGCTVVALALNRATAVCLPIKHKQVRRDFEYVLLLIFNLISDRPYSDVSFRFGTNFYWKYERNGIYIQYKNQNFRRGFFMSAYVIETIFVACIMIINVTMVIAFRSKYKVRLSTQPHLNQKVMSEKQRQEYNLNIVAGLTCVAEIVYYCYVIYVFGINTSVPTRVFYLLYDVINDIYCGLSGWLLLIYSRSMRAHVTKMMRYLKANYFRKTLLFLRCPMFGFRRMRIMIPPEQQFASSTNVERDKNTSNRRVPTCGTPC